MPAPTSPCLVRGIASQLSCVCSTRVGFMSFSFGPVENTIIGTVGAIPEKGPIWQLGVLDLWYIHCCFAGGTFMALSPLPDGHQSLFVDVNRITGQYNACPILVNRRRYLPLGRVKRSHALVVHSITIRDKCSLCHLSPLPHQENPLRIMEGSRRLYYIQSLNPTDRLIEASMFTSFPIKWAFRCVLWGDIE